MRIAFIGQKSVVLGARAGGIERHVAELGPRLVAAGHDVRVYARSRYGTGTPDFVDGMRMYYPPTLYTKHLEAIVHVFFSTLYALVTGADVFHYQGVGPSLLSWIPRLLKPRATVVVTFHARDQFHKKWGRFARAILHTGEWTACNVPNITITVSHSLQVLCRDAYRAQAVFIPSGAYVKHVEAAETLSSFGVSKGSYVLSVGRLLAVKGFHHLIKAYRTVKTDKKLLIVGAPNDKDGYTQKLKQLAQGDPRIQFLGFQSGKALEQLFAHAYLYCQPSESEGLPLAVLEAMGYGTAVLVSEIPGNLEAIHRAGFTFESRNVEDLANQLTYLLANPDDVIRAAADVRKVVEKHFDWEVVVKRTLEAYRSARH